MARRLGFLFLGFLFATVTLAQKPVKEKAIDVDFNEEDYDALFEELDLLLDSLTTPRSFLLFNLGLSNSFLNYEVQATSNVKARRQTAISPSLAYYSKTGFGLSVSTMMVDDGRKLSPFQTYITGSYDYLKNSKFITGFAATHYFTKDSLPFYTSPLENEVYGYFTYREFRFKPSVAVSYGWGSRSDYEERHEYLTRRRGRPRGYTTVDTRESVNDFNVVTSVRHDFYWMDVLRKKDYVRFTPQLLFASGTQRFGFNQTSRSYATVPRSGTSVLFNSDRIHLDDQLYFQPLSLSTSLKAEYSKGKFYVQPQFIVDYYFPATEKAWTTAFALNTGVIF